MESETMGIAWTSTHSPKKIFFFDLSQTHHPPGWLYFIHDADRIE
jgi:hypothetical protein